MQPVQVVSALVNRETTRGDRTTHGGPSVKITTPTRRHGGHSGRRHPHRQHRPHAAPGAHGQAGRRRHRPGIRRGRQRQDGLHRPPVATLSVSGRPATSTARSAATVGGSLGCGLSVAKDRQPSHRPLSLAASTAAMIWSASALMRSRCRSASTLSRTRSSRAIARSSSTIRPRPPRRSYWQTC